MGKESISRRRFLEVSGASVVASAMPGVAREGKAPGASARPNIILFMPDELRADALACLGNPVVKTPNFDRLAAEGALFSNCFVQFPVCGASRCSLLTGWPTSVRGHRSLFYFLRPDEPNLFKYLKQAGYDVYWYGKNDALAAESFPESVTEWDYYGAGASAQRVARSQNPWPLESPYHYSFLYNESGDRRDTGDYVNVQAAIRILERREQDRPFCIFLPLSSPHPPYTAPEGFYDLYDPASVPTPRPAGLARKPNFYQGIRASYHLERLTERDFRKIHAVYL
ncbi:MAG: sulfatase-like hydrolase/transferase, partial [Terriglobia bacterium]